MEKKTNNSIETSDLLHTQHVLPKSLMSAMKSDCLMMQLLGNCWQFSKIYVWLCVFHA